MNSCEAEQTLIGLLSKSGLDLTFGTRPRDPSAEWPECLPPMFPEFMWLKVFYSRPFEEWTRRRAAGATPRHWDERQILRTAAQADPRQASLFDLMGGAK